MATAPAIALPSSSFSSSSSSRRGAQSPLLTSISPLSARSLSQSENRRGHCRWTSCKKRWIVVAVSGGTSTAQYAKEMERVAAKEALLLTIKDNGGIGALTSASSSNAGSIDINEKILALERLNPTPRPTTSPLLEGLWELQWAGAPSPASIAARYFIKVLPSTLVSISALNLLIWDGSAKLSASFKILGTIDMSFSLTSKLTVEGPLRLKEEYVEGLLTTPSVPENTVPSQLKDFYDQAISSIQRLPDTLREALSGGLKVPLTGMFQRQLIISYLDDEILIVRDVSGAPEVLSRAEGVASVSAEPESEYVS
ncbi:hypothetical protein O6H91_08G078200 [Diphasiastrum complanatum]|uniref:Uncharacterized protein n=1 Tax=Diphasiastrum complanatum TaxID=34168 RepID=A0ACC2CZ68_DIPCM|nr:hypothetical protein O6H91_08G078200 [Diphasiastrum complanatum]